MSESNLAQPQWTKVPGEPADEPQAAPGQRHWDQTIIEYIELVEQGHSVKSLVSLLELSPDKVANLLYELKLRGIPAEPAAVTSVDTASGQVADAFASALDDSEPKPGKTISVNLGDMSLRELLAFSQGFLFQHRYPMAACVIRVAASLIRESENTDSTEMCRSLAGRLARECLTDLASGQLNEAVHGDDVPF